MVSLTKLRALPVLDRFGVLHWAATTEVEGSGVPPLVHEGATHCGLVTLELTPDDLRELTSEDLEPLRMIAPGVISVCPDCYPAAVAEP